MKTKLRTLYEDGDFNLGRPFTFGIKLRQWESEHHADYVIETSYTTGERVAEISLCNLYKTVHTKYVADFPTSGEAVRYAVFKYKELEELIGIRKDKDKSEEK